MHTILLLVAAAAHAVGSGPALSAAEGLPEMATPRQALQALKPVETYRAAAVAARRVRPRSELKETRNIHINVYTYSDGSFNVYEPFDARIDLRAYKPFSTNYDYQLSGGVGDQAFSGEARSRWMSDPKDGYIINGAGVYATLDRFGSGWILRGDAQNRDPQGRVTHDSFYYRLQRDFTDRYSVFELGLDVRIDVTSLSATVDGWYDKAKVGPMNLAVLGTVAGILSQPKLRQDPTRP